MSAGERGIFHPGSIRFIHLEYVSVTPLTPGTIITSLPNNHRLDILPNMFAISMTQQFNGQQGRHPIATPFIRPDWSSDFKNQAKVQKFNGTLNDFIAVVLPTVEPPYDNVLSDATILVIGSKNSTLADHNGPIARVFGLSLLPSGTILVDSQPVNKVGVLDHIENLKHYVTNASPPEVAMELQSVIPLLPSPYSKKK